MRQGKGYNPAWWPQSKTKALSWQERNRTPRGPPLQRALPQKTKAGVPPFCLPQCLPTRPAPCSLCAGLSRAAGGIRFGPGCQERWGIETPDMVVWRVGFSHLDAWRFRGSLIWFWTLGLSWVLGEI